MQNSDAKNVFDHSQSKINLPHEFALYFPYVDNIINSSLNFHSLSSFSIEDNDLVHRISKVLRLKKTENLVLFSNNYNIQAYIKDISSKKNITFNIIKINKNRNLSPNIIYGLPILKKQSFEDSVYSLVELGVQSIQPLITAKTQHKWIEKNCEKEFERLHKIVISACEQAKQFNVPNINPMLRLEDWVNGLVQQKMANLVFFDPEGSSSFEVFSKLRELNVKDLILLSGPEASLTEEEKELLLNNKFEFCSLTPTILRATEAVTIALGLARSLLL